MQTVNVLRDDRDQLALAFPLRKRQMCRIGLGIGIKHIVFVICEKFFGIFPQIGTAEHFFGRFRITALGIQTTRPAEIGNPTSFRDACAPEKDDLFRLLDHLTPILLFHQKSPLVFIHKFQLPPNGPRLFPHKVRSQ